MFATRLSYTQSHLDVVHSAMQTFHASESVLCDKTVSIQQWFRYRDPGPTRKWLSKGAGRQARSRRRQAVTADRRKKGWRAAKTQRSEQKRLRAIGAFQPKPERDGSLHPRAMVVKGPAVKWRNQHRVDFQVGPGENYTFHTMAPSASSKRPASRFKLGGAPCD